jgi:putative alpha-1,2-mannosidase
MGIGSPLFSKVVIKLNNKYYKGKTFTIIAKNNSATNMYVKSFNLNGKSLHTPFIPFSDITKGGSLTLQMSAQPKDAY